MEHPKHAISSLVARLAHSGIAVPAEAPDRWLAHGALIREWNQISGLVSHGDLDGLAATHLPDSLSLGPALFGLPTFPALLLDIGSGGGYPAVPLAILFPGMPVTLVERSQKKADFLRRVVSLLGLANVTVLEGEFPNVARAITAGVVTARAVEQSAKVHKALARWLSPGAVFLCQTGVPAAFQPPMFHVEQWMDGWEDVGLRRGVLHVVRRVAQ